MKYFFAGLCALGLLFLVRPAVADERPEVMIVNSYHPEFSWVKEHNSALEKELSRRADVSVYNLDSKRLPGAESAANVVSVRKICESGLPDVAVLTDDFALKSLGQYFVDRGVPVVFLGINGNVRGYVDNVRKITGVFERPLVKRSLVHLREIMGPEFKKVLVLLDDSLSTRVFAEESLKDGLSFDISGVHADVVLIKNFAQWKAECLSVKKRGYNGAVIGTYHIFRDRYGMHVDAEDVLRWTSRNCPVPLFALWDFSVGEGMAIGGFVISGTDQGLEAAKLVNRILDGEKVEDIQPVLGRRGRLLFSGHEMERWGIELPADFRRRGYLVRILR
ncbi:ABC transporter substrate-binding protein [Maridesulfovibrio sp. FT414]|uniref:ABC transporter substrate-binding protein n=1 Tax=Maridesulfovibrio sp. FT414 TaxID=2979469 RepID=UPI003D8031EF